MFFCMQEIEQNAERKINAEDRVPVLNGVNRLETCGCAGKERIHRWCHVSENTNGGAVESRRHWQNSGFVVAASGQGGKTSRVKDFEVVVPI